MLRKSFLIATLTCFTLLAESPFALATDCFNTGVVSTSKVDKKEKNNFAGDIKSIEVNYDYESNLVSGVVAWNKIPTSKQITTIIVGMNDSDGICYDVFETYKMYGWTKKFKKSDMYSSSDKDNFGRFSLTSSGKTSIAFEWTQAPIFSKGPMTSTCVSVETEGPATFYVNSTTCSGNGNITSCTGPGWVRGTEQLDLVINYAFSPSRELDTLECNKPRTVSSS